MDSIISFPVQTAEPADERPVLQEPITVGDIRDSKGVAIGAGATVIINEALSFAEGARQQQAFEREELARSVARLAAELRALALTPVSPGGNPYKNLLAYSLSDNAEFFGREEEVTRLVEELTCRESLSRLVVLHGEPGIGKTSLLNAGLTPQLIIQHHLPLIVPVTSEPLVEAIKGALLSDLDLTPQLKRISLKEFMRQVSDLLPAEARVCVLLDGFEAFFSQPAEARQHFIEELKRCLNDEAGRHSWLISIHSSRLGDLSTFQPAIQQPLAKTLSVPALSCDEARAAILEPARLSGYLFEQALVETILRDLGEDLIDPSSLQMVCHTLVNDLPDGEKQLALADYEAAGSASGILSRYLDHTLEQNLTSRDGETSWRLLAGLAERRTLNELTMHMHTYDTGPEETQRVLDLLVNNRLVQAVGEHYMLAHPLLWARVRQWMARQAALELARQEAHRQFERIRSSALRGLLGGGLGLMLSYGLAYYGEWLNPWLIYLSIQRLLPGAIAGVLLILWVDLALASYHGERRWLRWPTAGLAGAGTVAMAVAYHGFLTSSLNEFPAQLPSLLFEGLLWGLAAGLGTVWVRLSRRQAWQTLPLVALAGSLALWFGEKVGHAFEEPKLPWAIVVIGAILPVLIAASARLGRPIDKDG